MFEPVRIRPGRAHCRPNAPCTGFRSPPPLVIDVIGCRRPPAARDRQGAGFDGLREPVSDGAGLKAAVGGDRLLQESCPFGAVAVGNRNDRDLDAGGQAHAPDDAGAPRATRISFGRCPAPSWRASRKARFRPTR